MGYFGGGEGKVFPGYSIAKENISSDKFSIVLSSCYDLGVSCLLLASFYDPRCYIWYWRRKGTSLIPL